MMVTFSSPWTSPPTDSAISFSVSSKGAIHYSHKILYIRGICLFFHPVIEFDDLIGNVYGIIVKKKA